MNHSKPSSGFTAEFFKLTDQANSIFITSHKSTDDDSIASVLSIYSLLSERYPKKKVRIVYTGNPVDTFTPFKHFNKVKFVPDIADEVTKDSLLIMCDGSQFSRFTYKPDKLKQLPSKTICIDHHTSPIDDFDLSLVDPSASSCAELIYLSFHQKEETSKDLAEIYLLGILGDTGNFSYLKPSQTKTLSIAKRLLEIGEIEIQEFQSKYRTISTKVFALVQELIKNTEYHEVKDWPNFQTSYIPRQLREERSYTDNEISEASHIYMSHYLRVIKDHPWGFVITPKDNGDCSISLRSLPQNVSVRTIVEQIGIGGGHDRAAGGTFKMEGDKKVEVTNCMNKMMDWLKENKPVIL